MQAPAVILALALLASGGPALALGPEGYWQTQSDDAIVKITTCGDALCGSLVTSNQLKAHPDATDVRDQNAALRHRPLKGLDLFYGVKGGPKVWSGGTLYNPSDGRTYRGSITLVDPDTLRLTGCVWGPLCLSQTWRRLPSPG